MAATDLPVWAQSKIFGRRAVHEFAGPPQEAINTVLVWPRGFQRWLLQIFLFGHSPIVPGCELACRSQLSFDQPLLENNGGLCFSHSFTHSNLVVRTNY